MTENSKIVWEDPRPLSGKGVKGIWNERLKPLREKPGQWARVWVADSKDRASTKASHLRNGRIRVDGNFEFTSRDHFIYARYLGEEK